MTILDRVLLEVHQSKGPISVASLARRTGVATAAIDGMLATLRSQGRLVEGPEAGVELGSAACGGCATTCVGLDACPFVVTVPRSLSFPTLR